MTWQKKISNLQNMIAMEELSEVAKDELLKASHEIKVEVDKELKKVIGMNIELKDYAKTVETLRNQIKEMSERENNRVIAFEDEQAELQARVKELQMEKQETVEHYERQLKLKSDHINTLANRNSKLTGKLQLAEDLVIGQAEFLLNLKNKVDENY